MINENIKYVKVASSMISSNVIRSSQSLIDKYVNINGNKVAFDIIVKEAKEYIKSLGGFEKLAEWGLR